MPVWAIPDNVVARRKRMANHDRLHIVREVRGAPPDPDSELVCPF